MPNLVACTPETPLADMLSILQRDGGLILLGALSPDRLAGLRQEIDPFIFATPPGADDFGGRLTTRTGALIARSAVAREMAVNPIVLGLVEGFLSPFAERFQLHISQVIRLMPGQPAQPLHRDQGAWSQHISHIDAEVSAIYALTDFTEENGATLAVPGSGVWDSKRVPQPDEVCQAIMPAGSAIIYSGKMWHAGGANRSDSDRIGLQLSYTLGWLRQEENQYLSCPPDVAKGLPKAVTRLIGYDMGRYALGYFTPPVGPANGPEVINPEYALTGQGIPSYLGTASDAEGIMAETQRLLSSNNRLPSP